MGKSHYWGYLIVFWMDFKVIFWLYQPILQETGKKIERWCTKWQNKIQELAQWSGKKKKFWKRKKLEFQKFGMFRRNNLIVHSSLGQLSQQWPNFFHFPELFSSVAHQCLPVDDCKIHLSWYSPFHSTGNTQGLCLSLETVTQSTSPEILKVLKCKYLDIYSPFVMTVPPKCK